MTETPPPFPSPPLAPQRPRKTVVHGEESADPYHWLRERSNPEVIQYLEAENRYTEAVMAHAKPLEDKLYQEMLSRIKETDLDAPVRIDDFYYYSRTEKGKQYRIHCRKRGSLDAPEEVLLDGNALAEGKDYLSLGAFEPSPDHRLLAYSDDYEGSETYTLRIKDLETGELLADEIPNTYYSVEWANDNRTLFYNTLDEAKRPYKLFRHRLGESPAEDEEVFHEPDEAFFLGLGKTRSRAYLLLSLKSNTTSEIHYLPADEPFGQFRVIEPRRPRIEYSVDHHGERFFVMTNDGAKNFRLAAAPVSAPGRENWRDVIPHREEVLIEGFDCFRDHLAVYEREQALPHIRIRRMDGSGDHRISFPEPVYTADPAWNPEFDTRLLRFVYNSMVTPRSVFDYDMDERTRELKKQYEVLGGYDPSQYASERLFAAAPDGVRVPLSLVFKKDLRKDGSNPCLLYGYGAYGHSSDPNFSSNRLSLLDRGFVYAIAHVRGGEEMGRGWYEDGKLLRKKNTFTDFIACAERLTAEQYTSPERLSIYGGSAGGLLAGAAANMRPELFHAVIAAVPFVDVLNTMLDASIPLTVIEYEEWGNPNEKQFYDYIKSYSPYDNIQAKDYPHMLVTAGLNDPRVQYWEPAKYVAKLRATKTDSNRLLLKTKMGAGHSGPSGRYERLRETAFHYAFLLDVFGINE